MATVPAPPLFYRDIIPLSSNQHADWKVETQQTAPFLAGQHAVPVTVDEFVAASRHYPIVFASGENPVPLALMGLNEGVNLFVGDNGELLKPTYIPAYVRRYPFILLRLNQNSDELSLCFDPTAPGIGPDKDGQPLFDGDQPAQATRDILNFCEQFEQAGARTQAFLDELQKAELLMDGEVAINVEGLDQPFIYRGFRMVDEEKLRDLRGDALRKMSQSGLLPLLYAHLFSLGLMRDLFGEQVQTGKIALPNQTGTGAPAVPGAAAANDGIPPSVEGFESAEPTT